MFEERSRSQTLFALSPRKLTNFRHPRKNSDDCLGLPESRDSSRTGKKRDTIERRASVGSSITQENMLA